MDILGWVKGWEGRGVRGEGLGGGLGGGGVGRGEKRGELGYKGREG